MTLNPAPSPKEEQKVENAFASSPSPSSKPQTKPLGLSLSKPALSLGKKENRSIATELDAEFAPPSKQSKTEESAVPLPSISAPTATIPSSSTQ